MAVTKEHPQSSLLGETVTSTVAVLTGNALLCPSTANSQAVLKLMTTAFHHCRPPVSPGGGSELPEALLEPGDELLFANTAEAFRASLIAQLVKNLPAMQKTLVRFLGQEDPLEKGKATHTSILTWRIPWTV